MTKQNKKEGNMDQAQENVYEYNGFEIAARILKVSQVTAIALAVVQITLIFAIYA